MQVNVQEEGFNRSLYEELLPEDRKMIEEYIPKMSAGEINSFMRRLVDHYKLETQEDTLEVIEDIDDIIAFEENNISRSSKNISLFVDNFILSTKSAEDINLFFIEDNNFNFVVENPQFYKSNSPAFLHITKYFRLNRTLKGFLEDDKELYGHIWEGLNSYFERKTPIRIDLFAYIGSIVNRKLRKELDIGFICPFCSAYYVRVDSDKKSLISCCECKNRFIFAGLKCPHVGCNKIIPLTSIDKNVFSAADVKHMRAIRALNKYVDQEGMQYIADMLGLASNDVADAYKIPISTDLQKRKLEKLTEYKLEKTAATNVPEFLFYLPMICPITIGHSRTKQINSSHKHDTFRGCGNTFILRDGLRKVDNKDYFIYRTYDQRRIRYVDVNKYNDSYDEIVLSGREIRLNNNESNDVTENKIPYDRIATYLNKYANKLRPSKNKSMAYLINAIQKYFEEEYVKGISSAVDYYLQNNGQLSKDNISYMKNFDNFLNDKYLQNTLFYKNINSAYSVGWVPTDKAKDRIRELYIELVQDKETYVRKFENAELPMRFYTYRISEIHGRPASYKKRIGIAIDKTVLPATSRATAGYGQNFKMDINFLKVSLKKDNGLLDLTPFIKNGVYWSAENAIIHGFDNKTGIIWFNGEDIGDNTWKFPNGFLVGDNSDTLVSAVCTSDAFCKMFQRFDLNKKMREIVFDLESDGHI